MKSLKLAYSVLLLVVAPLFLHAAHAGNTTIDVLTLYTPGVADKYDGDPTARITHLFSITNQIFEDSNVDLQVRLVHTALVEYPETGNADTALQDMTYQEHPAFSEVADLRKQYGADMVILYRRWDASHGGCGVAWVGGNQTDGDFSGYWEKDYAYSHIAIDTCDDFVTSHELGHNLGLAHSRVQDGVGGTFDFALGHGEQSNFVTIMAYYSSFAVDQNNGKVYKFSSPDLLCKNRACGVEKSASDGADAVYTLNITAPQVANYLETKVIDDVASAATVAAQRQDEELSAAKSSLASATEDYESALARQQELQQAFNEAYEDYLALEASANRAFSHLMDYVQSALTQYDSASAGEKWVIFAEYVQRFQDYSDKIATLQSLTDNANDIGTQLEEQSLIVAEKQRAMESSLMAVNLLSSDLLASD